MDEHSHGQPGKGRPRKGRGAIGNPSSRFDRHQRVDVTDDWVTGTEDLPPLATVVTDEPARTVIARNDSPDIPFDRSVNPYRGCEHGCIYCYARPSHAYLGLSPGLDFETRLFAKTNAADVLAREIAKPGYRPAPLLLGANTDPYQPVERTRRITRAVLQVLAEARHPVAITTKSALVVRDIDILAPMAEQRLAAVGISLTTRDAKLAALMEPRASSPARRIEAIRCLSRSGIPVAALAAPMIPFVNDHELESLLVAAANAGASTASYTLVRLPRELKGMFCEWLQAHFPDRAERVLGRLRDCGDGSLYVSEFGTRMRGTGAYADVLANRFRIACAKLGLQRSGPAAMALDTSLFRKQAQPRAAEQLRLF